MKRPLALMVAGVAAAVTAGDADELHTASSPSISDARAFVCRAFVRPSIHVQPDPVEEIRMSEPGDRSVSSGAFRFRVLYLEDRYESPALITYVYSESTKKLIEQSLFQFDAQQRPVNQFTGFGFTGLHYVYAPDSAAELQYFCSRG